jgi:hypothetical protein
MGEQGNGVSRRNFIEGAAALAALVAAPRRGLAQSAEPLLLGDAHVHLFNLSDIPARGFFEHAVLWNTALDAWPVRPLWPAMLDMIAYLKGKSITASQELECYKFNPKAPEDIDKETFEWLLKQRVANMARQSRIYTGPRRVTPDAPLSKAQLRLRDSYYRLATVLGIAGSPPWQEQSSKAQRHILSDEDLNRIRAGTRNLLEHDCEEEPKEAGNMSPLAQVPRTLHWGRVLMQSRQYHVRTYLDRISDRGLAPSMIVNLLVDFDEWVGDDPAPGSEADAQIALWKRMRDDYARISLDIHTFAGFDPLREALELRGWFRGSRRPETTFARNRNHFLSGAIQGFKLYPPMGFRPTGNTAEMFAGNRRGLGVLHRRLAECGIPATDLPELLNEALKSFYDFCEENSVPILAHAYHSNEAALCTGERAGPRGWEQVIEGRDKLRICLGHFAEGVGFARAMRRHSDGRRVHPRHWPFHGTERLLLQNSPGKCEVFVDISYMAEFLNADEGRGRAESFFRALREYCERYDNRCQYFMFGSDWIMLEREARNDEYLSRMRAAMTAAGWTEAWQRNLLHDNLERFLRPPA